jgi:hypothetical protein
MVFQLLISHNSNICLNCKSVENKIKKAKYKINYIYFLLSFQERDTLVRLQEQKKNLTHQKKHKNQSYKNMKISNEVIIFLLAAAILLSCWWLKKPQTLVEEAFYNVLPTELIDPQYLNLSEVNGYYDNSTGQTFATVGGGGVDLNCNAVETKAILNWIRWNDPDVLNRYVFRFDPSANIYNPDDAPRILKALLRNLPSQHKYIPILQNCFPITVRV